MTAEKESIAAVNVTTSQGGNRNSRNNENNMSSENSPYSPNNLMFYHVSLGLIEKLVNSGKLSRVDFNKCRRVLTKKYNLPQDSIFAETA